jgi:hypothetical protein
VPWLGQQGALAGPARCPGGASKVPWPGQQGALAGPARCPGRASKVPWLGLLDSARPPGRLASIQLVSSQLLTKHLGGWPTRPQYTLVSNQLFPSGTRRLGQQGLNTDRCLPICSPDTKVTVPTVGSRAQWCLYLQARPLYDMQAGSMKQWWLGHYTYNTAGPTL